MIKWMNVNKELIKDYIKEYINMFVPFQTSSIYGLL